LCQAKRTQDHYNPQYEVETDRKDLFFDGDVCYQLAKIFDLNKPLIRLDIQIIKDEIQQNRPDETRDIIVDITIIPPSRSGEPIRAGTASDVIVFAKKGL